MMDARLAQGFPAEPRVTDREGGTRQCLALEHRGCANWTSGSVASVQINREAAQKSPGAVRGIGEETHTRKRTLVERGHTQMRTRNYNCRQTQIGDYVRAPRNASLEIQVIIIALPDRTRRLRGRGAIPGRARR